MLRLAITLLLPLGATRSVAGHPASSTTGSIGGRPAVSVEWQGWYPGVFAEAKASHRLVLLDLEAEWCHWCHVMEAETYSDPKVRALIQSRYLPIKVDQDSAPDLAARYGNWGWPATIVFAPDGTEIVKRRGFIPAVGMVALLEAIVADPTPGPSVVAEPESQPGGKQLDPATRKAIEERLDRSYDVEHGGWGEGHRLVQAEAMEREIHLALAATTEAAEAAKRAKQTLDGLRRLIDPVWGGLYQYSDKPDWSSPHFERLMTIQADGIRTFALAYAAFHDPRDLLAAKDIARFMTDFLSGPDGSFFVSMDADLSAQVDGHVYAELSDEARRAKGIPRVDRHVYPRENGLAIEALAELAAATGEGQPLARALRALPALEPLQAADGSYSHAGQPSLEDTLAMGRAFLALAEATGEPALLARAMRIGKALDRFRDPKELGFVSESQGPTVGVFQTPVRDVDENVSVARFANLLFREGGDVAQQARAQTAMRLISSPQEIDRPELPFGTLLADDELRHAPLHVVVVGTGKTTSGALLLEAARAAPTRYKWVQRWDPSGDPNRPTTAADIPAVPPKPLDVAYACGPNFCSPPARTKPALQTTLSRQLASW